MKLYSGIRQGSHGHNRFGQARLIWVYKRYSLKISTDNGVLFRKKMVRNVLTSFTPLLFLSHRTHVNIFLLTSGGEVVIVSVKVSEGAV